MRLLSVIQGHYTLYTLLLYNTPTTTTECCCCCHYYYNDHYNYDDGYYYCTLSTATTEPLMIWMESLQCGVQPHSDGQPQQT